MRDEVGRVRVNLRVDEGIKTAFDEEIMETFGKLSPYAGIELERELRLFLDQGDIADLCAVVDDLDGTFGDRDSKEKIREFERGETTTVGYRVAEHIREEIIAVSNDDFRDPGRLIESVMYRYVTDGNAIRRLSRKLRRLSDGLDSDEDESMGAKERRTQTIAAQLDEPGRIAFDLADFERAVEAAKGIGWSDYVRDEYLPRVLDELGFTWDSENPGRFIDPACHDLPSVRDPTRKPYYLMDRDDKRLAIKVAAYRTSKGRQWGTFTVEDAVDTLEGRVRKTTIRPLMREIADSSPGYEFNRKAEKMRVRPKEVRDNPRENLGVIAIEHTIDNWVESAAKAVQEFCDEHDVEIDDVPNAVLDNKIATARYPDLLTGSSRDHRSPPDYITEEDRDLVLEKLDELRMKEGHH